MIKIKVTRTDGTIIEAEGPAEELLKLNLIPWQLMPYQPISITGTYELGTDGFYYYKK